MLDHLKNKEGYVISQNTAEKTDYDSSAISKIYRLVSGEKKVDVIITHWTCTLAPIFQFHSTVVMNYITARSVICLYPRWTTASKGLIHPRMYLDNMTHLRTVHELMKYKRWMGVPS